MSSARPPFKFVAFLLFLLGPTPVEAAPSFCPVEGRPELCVRTECASLEAEGERRTFHEGAQCMRNIRDAWHRGMEDEDARDVFSNLARRFVDRVLLEPVREVGRNTASAAQPLFVERNDRGLAFNAMGQSGVAYFLLQFARLADQAGEHDAGERYRHLAIEAIEILIMAVEDGGLSLLTKCGTETCVWFHSVTRRDWTSAEGGTLNQNLHTIRNLLMILDNDFDLPPPLLRRIEKATAAAIRQLLTGSDPTVPTLRDYLPLAEGKGFAFYGARLNARSAPTYYRLEQDGLDCHYHVHATQLLFQIMDIAARHAALSGLAEQGLSHRSPLWRYEAAVRNIAPERAGDRCQ